MNVAMPLATRSPRRESGGAIIGSVTVGNPVAGAAIGGAVGAAGVVIIPQLGHDAARLVGAT